MDNYKLTYYSTVRNGKVSKPVASEIAKDLEAFEGKKIEISINKVNNKRSLLQNALYWVYVTILSDELGYSKHEIHEILKYKFLKKDIVNEKTGEVLSYIDTTTRLTRTAFMEFVESIRTWATDYNIELPEPGKQIELI